MAHTYWIKSYISILDDPKIARLPDYLWRMRMELQHIAGEYGKDGSLPPVADIAWRLRLDEVKAAERLSALSQVGEVAQDVSGAWYIPHFAEQQGPSPTAQRVKAHREKRKREQEELKRFVTPDTETDTETETNYDDEESPPRPNCFRLYEQNIGTLTPMLAEKLRQAEKDYPEDWMQWAFDVAVTNGARNWAYVEACLKNRKAGREPRKNGNGHKPAPPPLDLSWVEDMANGKFD